MAFDTLKYLLRLNVATQTSQDFIKHALMFGIVCEYKCLHLVLIVINVGLW